MKVPEDFCSELSHLGKIHRPQTILNPRTLNHKASTYSEATKTDINLLSRIILHLTNWIGFPELLHLVYIELKLQNYSTSHTLDWNSRIFLQRINWIGSSRII